MSKTRYFIVYRDANGRYACRGANKEERDRINRRSGGGPTHFIYNGASRENARGLRLPSGSTVMPALQTSAGLRIVLHGTAQLNSNQQARDAFIVAASNRLSTFATFELPLSTGGPDPDPGTVDGRQSSYWRDDGKSR